MYLKLALTLGLKVGSVVGALVGLVICSIAWQHNPQCAIHCDGIIEWQYLFQLWLFWFAVVGIAGGLVTGLCVYFYKLILSREAS